MPGEQKEKKKRLKNMRRVFPSAKPHTFHPASRRMVCCPPHAVSFALALYFLSVLLSFPRWEMILSLCPFPDALSTQGPVDLCGVFL